MQPFRNIGYYAAVLFNTMFAILSTVTLVGIVFVTRPQQVLHNVPPNWWIPLMLIMVPSQAACQYLTWKTIFSREVPSPLDISRNQPALPTLLRTPVALLWAANFLIGFVIAVSLYKPNPGKNIELDVLILVAFITFALTTAANVYLMLFARTATSNEKVIHLTWRFRIVIDVVIAVTAIVYYKIAF
jgi:hypothetical protein